jgi:hypothetical protein
MRSHDAEVRLIGGFWWWPEIYGPTYLGGGYHTNHSGFVVWKDISPGEEGAGAQDKSEDASAAGARYTRENDDGPPLWSYAG